MKENNKLTTLPNIGKVIAAKLEKIDIKTADDFLASDPFVIFDKMLKKVDPTLCRCALASIVGAKTGVPWHKIHKEAAKEFKKRYPEHLWKDKC